VFKTKFKADGTIESRKARLVARGFQKAAGLDYEETFSPVVKARTVRITLSMTVYFNWEVRQMDINNAFLNVYLKETAFIYQPEGFIYPSQQPHFLQINKGVEAGSKGMI